MNVQYALVNKQQVIVDKRHGARDWSCMPRLNFVDVVSLCQ